MNAWAVALTGQRYEAERLFHHDTLDLTGLDEPAGPVPGDDVVVVVAGDRPLVVALGRVRPAPVQEHDPDDPQSADGGPPLVVAYTRRAFDTPVPAEGLALTAPVTRIDPAAYRALAARIGPPGERRSWLVSLDLPIEAPSPAEAVRTFWSYVMELGPRELPAFVSPSGDELALQAYVLGEQASQDPEEDG